MPIYEYKCTKCREKFEVVQKASDPPPKKCGKCGGPLKKLVTAPAIQFKGKGWYITDYPRQSKTGKEDVPKTKQGKTEPAAASPSTPAAPSSSDNSSSSKK